MRQSKGFIGVFSVWLIVTLALALVIAWVGYEPMVVRRMSDEAALARRDREATCETRVQASAPVVRQYPVADDPNAADMDYAFNVRNDAIVPCRARYEASIARGADKATEVGNVVLQPRETRAVVLPLGRYTRADYQAGRLPRSVGLHVWGEPQ